MVSSQARLAVFGVALHALLIYAMFDVHFLTPLVHGMEQTTFTTSPRPRRGSW